MKEETDVTTIRITIIEIEDQEIVIETEIINQINKTLEVIGIVVIVTIKI